jgi:L-rhamnose mutarotase
MKTYAFRMKIPPESAAEYKKRHDEIWPDLLKAHRDCGIRDYSIFLDRETGDLFASLKLTEAHQLEQLGQMEVVKRWWAMNKDIQVYEGDQPMIRPLNEVFRMD